MLSKKYIKTAFILTISLFIFFVSNAYAKIVYTVKKGDNPSTIAKKYKVSVNDIKRENNIDPRNLRPGQKIIIPVKSTASNKKGKSHPQKTEMATNIKKPKSDNSQNENARSLKSSNDISYHTVRKGDTISSISKKYSISQTDLKELNGLRSSKLKRDQKLLVKRIGPKTYTIKKGDNIWTIARRFNLDPDDLMELNELETPSLKIGQKLYLEENIETVSADNRNGILTKNIEEELKILSEAEIIPEKDKPNQLITFAKKLIDIPYKFGGNSFLGIDCSGYVKKVYGFLGIELPRTAREQFNSGESIEKEELSIGDLVFFRTYASFPSHVGIYLGNNLFIHASSKGKKVTIDSLDTPYYLKRFIGGKRLLKEDDSEMDHQG